MAEQALYPSIKKYQKCTWTVPKESSKLQFSFEKNKGLAKGGYSFKCLLQRGATVMVKKVLAFITLCSEGNKIKGSKIR